MKRFMATVVVCGALMLPAAAGAGEPAKPAPDNLVATVQVVRGTVEARPAVGEPWAPVKVGMQLKEGADLRTGFRALCLLDTTDSLVQVDPLTVIRIGELRREGGTVRTRLYMKHGNTQAVVEKKPVPSDFAIVTPSATLSVRGTDGIKAGYFPDVGGSYGLAGRGLIAIRDVLLGRLALVRKDEKTNDQALPPIQQLAALYLPVVLDQKGGYEPTEVGAAGRWHTSTPFLGGLQGPLGPPNQSTQQASQQKDPLDPQGPIDIIPPPPPPPEM